MQPSACAFCGIVSGESPAAKLFEDEYCLAFLDIHPIFKGHALVIPKAHSRDLLDAPRAALGPMLEAARRCAPAIVETVGADGFNLIQANGSAAGQTVFHLHFHILPRHRDDTFLTKPLAELKREAMTERFDELQVLAADIRAKLPSHAD